MKCTADAALGRLLREKREAAGLSQMELSRKMGWPQAKLSRVEQGKRSATLPELLSFSQVFRLSVGQLLGELDSSSSKAPAESVRLTPGFFAVYEDEDALLTQLERYGVRFLGGGQRPALVDLPLDEVVLAALRFAHDPRVFEALPALLLRNVERVDWSRLMAAAYALRLQNRLGMVVAAALALKGEALGVEGRVWTTLREVHDSLAQAKLDREDVVGPRPRTEAARAYLRGRTPGWLSFWHVLGSADLDSFRRHLPR